MFIKGLFYLVLSQFAFVVSGFAINFGLARIFGPEMYGTYSVIVSILVWVELFVISGIPIALQKFIAEDSDNAHLIKHKMFKIQLVFALIIFALFFIFSKYIALAFKEPELTIYFRVVSIDIIFNGLFRFYVGFQNGLRKFNYQAILLVAYTVFKLIGTFVLVLLGFSLMGALLALIIASIIGWIIGIYVSRGKCEEREYDCKRMINFTISNLLYSILLSLCYYIDLWSVRYFLEDACSGYYNAASIISKIPCFIFFALSGVILPSISKSIYENNKRLTEEYIQHSMRLMLIIFIPSALIVASTAESLIVILYSDLYYPAIGVLKILFTGFTFFTLFTVINTILIADNQINKLFVITLVLVVLDFLLNIWLVPLLGIKGGAIATTSISILGAIISGFILFRRFGLFISLSSLMKICFASIIIFVISNLFEISGIMLFGFYLLLAIIYLLGLLGLREITKDEIYKLFQFMH